MKAPRIGDSSYSSWSVVTRMNIVIVCTFLTVVVSVIAYNGYREQLAALDFAKEQTRDITTFYFDSLNTMMLTGTMDQRTVLRTKILRRPNIKVARVIRGQPVKQQFGEGFPEEQPIDEYDRRALTGEEQIFLEESDEGRMVTVITPFKATHDTRGVDCLQCHQVPVGAVNGAIRVSFSLVQLDQKVNEKIFADVVINALMLIMGLVMINTLLSRWLTRPLKDLVNAVKRRADGDVLARADIARHDEIGRLGAAFNEMSERVNDSVTREHDAAQELRDKVNVLLDVVSRAARGDLSGQVRISGDDAIGELAQVIQIMINNLRLLLKEKHDAVEEVRVKVDRILSVVIKAAEGDLTGSVDIQGEDAIGRLGLGVQRMIDNLNALVSQVQHSGIQVTSSATEIAATAKQQAATMAQQAATVNEIVSTSTEISATARSLLDTMNEVASVAEDTAEFAINGQSELAQMETTMTHVVEASSVIADKLETLREKAATINTVVTTITKVADQTNLLSLNAAIEAEKAGEHGLGFAVVATEIRRLADQTAVASWDIEQLIKKMQAAVTSSVMGVERFSEDVRRSVAEVDQVSAKLTRIIEQVRVLTPRYESVREGMQFQAQGAIQIKQAITTLHESAQQTVQSLKHSGASIDKLNEAAHGLQRGVSKFKVLTPKVTP